MSTTIDETLDSNESDGRETEEQFQNEGPSRTSQDSTHRTKRRNSSRRSTLRFTCLSNMSKDKVRKHVLRTQETVESHICYPWLRRFVFNISQYFPNLHTNRPTHRRPERPRTGGYSKSGNSAWHADHDRHFKEHSSESVGPASECGRTPQTEPRRSISAKVERSDQSMAQPMRKRHPLKRQKSSGVPDYDLLFDEKQQSKLQGKSISTKHRLSGAAIRKPERNHGEIDPSSSSEEEDARGFPDERFHPDKTIEHKKECAHKSNSSVIPPDLSYVSTHSPVKTGREKTIHLLGPKTDDHHASVHRNPSEAQTVIQYRRVKARRNSSTSQAELGPPRSLADLRASELASPSCFCLADESCGYRDRPELSRHFEEWLEQTVNMARQNKCRKRGKLPHLNSGETNYESLAPRVERNQPCSFDIQPVAGSFDYSKEYGDASDLRQNYSFEVGMKSTIDETEHQMELLARHPGTQGSFIPRSSDYPEFDEFPAPNVSNVDREYRRRNFDLWCKAQHNRAINGMQQPMGYPRQGRFNEHQQTYPFLHSDSQLSCDARQIYLTSIEGNKIPMYDNLAGSEGISIHLNESPAGSNRGNIVRTFGSLERDAISVGKMQRECSEGRNRILVTGSRHNLCPNAVIMAKGGYRNDPSGASDLTGQISLDTDQGPQPETLSPKPFSSQLFERRYSHHLKPLDAWTNKQSHSMEAVVTSNASSPKKIPVNNPASKTPPRRHFPVVYSRSMQQSSGSFPAPWCGFLSGPELSLASTFNSSSITPDSQKNQNFFASSLESDPRSTCSRAPAQPAVNHGLVTPRRSDIRSVHQLRRQSRITGISVPSLMTEIAKCKAKSCDLNIPLNSNIGERNSINLLMPPNSSTGSSRRGSQLSSYSVRSVNEPQNMNNAVPTKPLVTPERSLIPNPTKLIPPDLIFSPASRRTSLMDETDPNAPQPLSPGALEKVLLRTGFKDAYSDRAIIATTSSLDISDGRFRNQQHGCHSAVSLQRHSSQCSANEWWKKNFYVSREANRDSVMTSCLHGSFQQVHDPCHAERLIYDQPSRSAYNVAMANYRSGYRERDVYAPRDVQKRESRKVDHTNETIRSERNTRKLRSKRPSESSSRKRLDSYHSRSSTEDKNSPNDYQTSNVRNRLSHLELNPEKNYLFRSTSTGESNIDPKLLQPSLGPVVDSSEENMTDDGNDTEVETSTQTEQEANRLLQPRPATSGTTREARRRSFITRNWPVIQKSGDQGSDSFDNVQMDR